MFDSERYASSAVTEKVDPSTQNLLWLMIEGMQTEHKDRRQRFELSGHKGKQRVIHSQEKPPYQRECVFTCKTPFEGVIYAVDNGPSSIMLLDGEWNGEKEVPPCAERVEPEEQTFTCSCCNREYNNSQRHNVNGDEACPDCYEERTLTCSHCGEQIWEDDNVGNSSTILCASCRVDYYTYCERCDCLLLESNACYDDEEEHAYCENCYDRYKIGVIHEYGFKPEPIFYGKGKRFFGVELEIDGGGTDGKNAARLLETANQKDTHIYIKTDGSLDEGLELVTHPCTLDYHRDNLPWQEIMHQAIALDYLSHRTTTCGLHIHINRSSFSEDRDVQEECISRVLFFVEKHWEELLKFSRRSESQLNRWAARYGMKNSPKEILDHAKKGNNGRYTCINLINYDTIEFRIFRGTLKYNTLIATLQLVDAICEVAFSMPDKQIAALSWTSFAESITAPELISYLKERRLYINEPVIILEEEV